MIICEAYTHHVGTVAVTGYHNKVQSFICIQEVYLGFTKANADVREARLFGIPCAVHVPRPPMPTWYLPNKASFVLQATIAVVEDWERG